MKETKEPSLSFLSILKALRFSERDTPRFSERELFSGPLGLMGFLGILVLAFWWSTWQPSGQVSNQVMRLAFLEPTTEGVTFISPASSSAFKAKTTVPLLLIPLSWRRVLWGIRTLSALGKRLAMAWAIASWERVRVLGLWATSCHSSFMLKSAFFG